MPGALEFMVELNAKLDGISEGVRKLTELDQGMKKVDGQSGKTEQHLDKLSGAHKKAGDAAGKHTKHVDGLGHAFKEAKESAFGFAEAMGLVLAYEVAEKLFEKIKDVGSEIINAGSKAERASISFKLLLGNEGGEDLLKYIDDIAKHTEFTDVELKGMAQTLLKAGFSLKQLPRAMAAGLDIAAFSANPMEGMQSALSALERMKLSGHVDARVLRGFGVSEKDFFGELAARTHKGAKQLKKEMEAGKFNVEEGLEALYTVITKKTGKDLGGAGVTMSKSMGAIVKHLQDIPDQMYQALAETPAFEKLKGFFSHLFDILNPEGKVGARRMQSLEGTFSRVVDVLASIDIEKWADRFIAVLDLLPQVLSMVGSVANGVAEFFGELTAFGDALGESIYDADQFLFGLWDQAKKIVDYLADLPNQVFEKAMDVGGAIWRGIKEGLLGGVRYVEDAISSMATGALDKMKGVLGIHSPSRAFERLGEMSSAGYVRGIDQRVPDVDAAIERSVRLSDVVPAGAFARPAPLQGGAGGVQLTVNVTTTVNVGGGQGAPDADEIGRQNAEQIRSIAIGEIVSLLEQLNLGAGAGA